MRIQYKPRKHPRPIIYNKSITLNIDEKTLNTFKEIVGKGYQVKIRELMQLYIDAYRRNVNDKK